MLLGVKDVENEEETNCECKL